MRAEIQQHDHLLQDVLRRHGGAVLTERGEGDSFFAAFSRASDAIAAALEAQLRLQSGPLRVRMAIHTGEAGDDYRGPDVNRCARLRSAAHGEQILVSGRAAELAAQHLPVGASLRSLGRHRLKDVAEPLEVLQLEHPDLRADFPPLRVTMEAPPDNLPARVVELVGRDADAANLATLVASNRLITVTGPGGAGKTSLALEAARRVAPTFTDGVCFVDLAAVAVGGEVAEAVGAGLALVEIHGTDAALAIADYLADRELLLVLDCCEHVADSTARLTQRVLAASPGATILATSREPLGVGGELAWTIPPLSDDAAVELFASRSACESESALEICRRLDMMPLAIELAAARARLLGVAVVRDRLDQRFRLLGGGGRSRPDRQQTLLSTIEWSYELLSAEECELFRALGIFPGTFDLAAVESIAPELDVLTLLPQLVQRSLVVAQPGVDGGMRYRLLESLREFARAKLAADEREKVARRHFEHYASICEGAYVKAASDAAGAARLMELEHENIAAALDFAVAADPERHLALAGAATSFWKGTLRHDEGRRHLELALARPGPMDGARARALSAAGLLANWQSRYADAKANLQAALTYWRGAADLRELAICLNRLGWAHFMNNELEPAERLFGEQLELSREQGDEVLAARAEGGLVQVLVGGEETARARPIALRYLELGRQVGDPDALHLGYHFLGDCALLDGDCLEAVRNYRESLVLAMEIADPIEASFELQGIAMAAAGLGEPEAALVLAGAAFALRDRLGARFEVRFWDRLLDRYLAPARATLGVETSRAATERGAAMTFGQAVEFAIAWSEHR